MCKKIAVLLCALLSAGMLASCGSGAAGSGSAAESSAPAESTAPASSEAAPAENGDVGGEEIVLRMGIQDDDLPKSHQGAIDWMKEAYPNVTIDITSILNKEYVDKMTVMLAGGDDIDIIYAKNVPQYITMLTNGQTIDIMPRVVADGIDTAMYNGAIEKLTVDGKLHGMPFRSDIWQLYYNKNLFEAEGVEYPTDDMTWDEYAEMCRKLTSGSGSDKVYGGYFHSWNSCAQNITVQDGKNTVVSRDYEFMRPAYEMILSLQESGDIMDYAAITTGSLHYSGVFYNQQAATVYQGSWFINLLLTEMKENGLDFEWGVVKAPHPESSSEGTIVGTVFPMCINSKSKNPDMAWEYIKYLSGKECADYMASQGALAAATDDAILSKFVSQEGMPADCASAFEYSALSLEVPANPKAGTVQTILNEEHGLVMTNSVTVDEFIENLNSRVGEALNE